MHMRTTDDDCRLWEFSRYWRNRGAWKDCRTDVGQCQGGGESVYFREALELCSDLKPNSSIGMLQMKQAPFFLRKETTELKVGIIVYTKWDFRAL